MLLVRKFENSLRMIFTTPQNCGIKIDLYQFSRDFIQSRDQSTYINFHVTLCSHVTSLLGAAKTAKIGRCFLLCVGFRCVQSLFRLLINIYNSSTMPKTKSDQDKTEKPAKKAKVVVK